MAKAVENIKARKEAIAFWGKDLARRAKRKCELCEESGALLPHDTDPNDEPSLDTLILLCERCTVLVGGTKQDPRTLRFLEGAVWNEVPLVAGLAKRVLATVDETWARDCLEMVS